MKKGFTLVELLGTITILGVIMLIVSPIARNIINSSKEELYEVQVANIEDALKNWVVDNSRLLPENEGETITITLGQLKAGGYVEAELRNPKNNKCFGNDMLLTVTRHQKNYIYNVEDESSTETDTCDEYLKPYIILNGDAIVYVEVGEGEYFDLGASAIGTDGADISSSITTSISGSGDTIDTSVVGNSYTITYKITEGDNTTSINRKVIVNDTIPPELIIPDNVVLDIYATSLDVMDGVSATDNSGESVDISAKSNISFDIPGEYTITYVATDSSGNTTTKKRVITELRTHDIIYKGITNNGYPTKVIANGDLEIKFNNPPSSLVVYIDGVKDNSKYTYENGILKVNDVNGDVLVEYKEKVYLTSLPKDTYFKESTYLTKIKTISFVDYIDIPSDRLVTYDLSKDGDNSIIGWVDKDYNLYIGSDFKIYATDLKNAFRGMSGVTSITFNNLNTSETTTMYQTFNGMTSLVNLDVSNFETAKVTSMEGMFYNCKSLTTLDLSNFNTSLVTSMYQMFENCNELTSLNLDNWNTAKVKVMMAMFRYCKKLSSLDLSSFNTSNVTMASHMFQDVGSKSTSSSFSLKLGDNFDLSKVTDLNYMFQGVGASSTIKNCTIDLGSNFATSNVINMTQMFYRACRYSTTTSINLGNKFDTSKVTDMTAMFGEVATNNSDFVLDLGDKFVFKDGVTTTNFAYNCGASKLIIPESVTNIPNSTFSNMRKLKEIVFEHPSTSTITLPTPGSSTGAFYTSTALNTTVTTTNDTIKNYDWATDNRTVTFK